MYGWRCKIGLISPPDNLLIEPELYDIVPPGVSIHSTRLTTIDRDEMPREAEHVADQFGTANVDVVAYACTLSSFHDGPGSDEEVASRLQSVSGLPVTTASTAMRRALDALSVNSVSVVTPYNKSDNELLRTFLTDDGITVSAMDGLGLSATDETDAVEIGRETARDTYQRVVQSFDPESDAVLVTATNLACLETLETIEADLGVPVVATNQALLWHAFSLCGVDQTIDGFGKLFADG